MSASTNIMAVWNGGTSFTRNTNCIMTKNYNGYDTSGISLSINGFGGIGATLISNRHVLLANHTSVNFSLPTTVYFVNNSNITFTYTITSVSRIGTSFGTGYTDISIGYLNTIVDSSLIYYKVFPSNFLDYLKKGASYSSFQYLNPYLAAFYMDQEKKFLCGDIDGLNLTDVTSPKLNLIFSQNTKRYNNSELAIGGDSGNIIFLPVNNEIVLLGSWYTGSPGSKSIGNQIGVSSYICPNISSINSAMTSLAGTSYSLTEINLSNYSNSFA
jgi:hypothetical protein